MKCISIAIATFCVALASTASAQTFCEEIGGGGTPDSIARFTGRCKVGNSNIFQSPTGSIGIGTLNPDSTLTVANSSNSPTANGLPPYAIYGYLTSSTVSFSAAIRGDSLATTGNGIGVIGETDSPGSPGVYGLLNTSSGGGFGVNGVTLSPAGNGVFGNYPLTTGGGGGGVVGLTNSADFGFSYAIKGEATAPTGSALGIFGAVSSPDGAAGYFLNRNGGNIIVGHTGINDTLSVFRVDSTGRVFADGGFQPNGADFAESMAVTGDRSKYAAGDLLVLDPTASRRLALARQPYSTLVAGIFSTKPGLLGTNRKVDESTPQNEVPLAVVGIVPCKVTAENGAIRIGDLLVTSSTTGHAMKGTDRSRMLGAVVGKALEPLLEGKGVINVLVTLQ
jgi:hypothetical protein